MRLNYILSAPNTNLNMGYIMKVKFFDSFDHLILQLVIQITKKVRSLDVKTVKDSKIHATIINLLAETEQYLNSHIEEQLISIGELDEKK